MEEKRRKKVPEDIKDAKLLAMLEEYYRIGINYYRKIHRKMQLLDGVDKGELWKAVCAKFPPYQLLPDTNYISYVKQNILASAFLYYS